MTLSKWLPGRAQWLAVSSTFANGLVALVASQYAVVTLELPKNIAGTFWLLVASIAVAGLAATEFVAVGRLSTLRALSTGRLLPTDRDVLAALKEARQFPDVIARSSGAVWAGAVAILCVLLRVVVEAPWALVGRVVLLGALFGPMAAVVVALFVTRRAHVVVERLAEGLSLNAVLSTLGAPSASVGRQVLVFTVVMVALPTMVTIDVVRVLGQELVERFLALEPAAGAAFFEKASIELAIKSGLLVLLSAVMAGISAAVGGGLLARPLQKVAGDATALAQGTVETARLIAGDGEVWLIGNVFARLKERLVALVERLSSAAGSIREATRVLHQASSGAEGGAVEQAAALNQTSATTEELAQSARQIASSAARVQELARKTLEAAESGLSTSDAFRAAIERMRQDNRSIAAAVERLSHRVQQIGRIVDVINTVADRSDLLALSAELEGTRAGEVGRGFSLVASEMRRLAENVLESTAEVEELISEIRTATRQTAEATERARDLTESGTALADEVARALTIVAQSARQTSDAVRTISLATQQQQTGTDQLAEAMADILGITQQSLVSTRQLSAANERLQTLSADLSTVVNQFRT